MPRGDGTGPNGMGPLTGRKIGYCAGFNSPGYLNGGRRIRRYRLFNQPMIKKEQSLEEEIAILEERLKLLKKEVNP
ncbi:MAG: DUF5320 domain-containing protein [Clostridia bacterium]|nr:DUF5320 domain-containing protein [Clostridia bacterium]